MPRPRRKVRIPFLVRFRGLLLVGLLGGVGMLVALFLFGRSGIEAPTPAVGTEELGSQVPGGVTVRSEGFDYTHYDEGEPLFRVRGDTQTIDRDQRSHLEGVEIELFQEEGDSFRAVSERAVYDEGTKAAELDGAVHLVGQDGFELWTEHLQVGKEGRRIVSRTPVRFLYGEAIEGSSQRMRAEVASRLFLLQGKVRLRSTSETGVEGVLRAERGFFEEDRRLLRAEGKVRLTYGQDFVEAERLSAYLVDDRDAVRYIRAQWDVRGRLSVPARGLGGDGETPTPIAVGGEALSLLLDETGERPTKIEIEGSDRYAAELSAVDGRTGVRQTITSNYMVGDFDGATLGTVHAFGQVRIADAPEAEDGSTEANREARAERAEGSISAEGSLEILTLLGSVDYREGTLQVRSDRANFDLIKDRSVFRGEPARMEAPEGDVTAKTLSYDRNRRLLQAGGGVRTALQVEGAEAVPGPLLSSGAGPVWVVSEKARWQRDNDLATFLVGVRAWRGEDLLLADELRIQRVRKRLEAKGNVKTVWHPEPSDSGSEQISTLEVSAQRFVYDGIERRIRYNGAVEILEDLRTMNCGIADILLDGERSIRVLECLGGAKLREKKTGRLAQGRRAVYDPGAGEIRFWGDPVVLRDRRGTELKGQHLVYRLEDGSVEFKAAERDAEPKTPPGRAEAQNAAPESAEEGNTPAMVTTEPSNPSGPRI